MTTDGMMNTPKQITNPTKLSPLDQMRNLVQEEVQKLTLFEFSYRPKHRVQKDLVMGTDLMEVKARCLEFCNRHNIIYVYVRPACLNLDAGLRNYQGEQSKDTEPAT